MAHELAQVCFFNKDFNNWVDEPSSFLLDRLINDVIFDLMINKASQNVGDAAVSLKNKYLHM